MGTLYIDRKNMEIRLDGNALAFYVDNVREGMVPINPLERVIVVGRVKIETPVLHRLARENVSVLFLSGRGMKFSGILHGKVHNNGLLRLKQYGKATGPIACIFARSTVLGKVENQREFLREVVRVRPDRRFEISRVLEILENIISSLNEAPDPSLEDCRAEPGGDIMATYRGFEGAAAAAYFSGYTSAFPDSLGFIRRTKRPPKDPVNALLSLTYTLLHYECVREITLIGLDPTIGFLHQFEYGRESLACDLVESFRTDADRFVWTLCRQREFTARDFLTDDETGGCYLKKGGRNRFYARYEGWSKEIRPRITGEARSLARHILDGEEPFNDEEVILEN